MRRWLCVLFASSSLISEEPTNRFEGYYEKFPPLKIASYYLPYNPVIVQADVQDGKEALSHNALWPAATIYAFACQPGCFDTLAGQTASKNRIIPLDFALHSFSGIAPLYFDEKTASFSLLPPLNEEKTSPQTEVCCTKLDSWAESYGIQKIDLLWLTAGGNELQILKHSPHMLSTVKVIYTQTYFLPFRRGTTQFHELRAFLEGAGFVLLAHWYQQGVKGTALFLKRPIFHAAFFKGRNP